MFLLLKSSTVENCQVVIFCFTVQLFRWKVNKFSQEKNCKNDFTFQKLNYLFISFCCWTSPWLHLKHDLKCRTSCSNDVMLSVASLCCTATARRPLVFSIIIVSVENGRSRAVNIQEKNIISLRNQKLEILELIKWFFPYLYILYICLWLIVILL